MLAFQGVKDDFCLALPLALTSCCSTGVMMEAESALLFCSAVLGFVKKKKYLGEKILVSDPGLEGFLVLNVSKSALHDFVFEGDRTGKRSPGSCNTVWGRVFLCAYSLNQCPPKSIQSSC